MLFIASAVAVNVGIVGDAAAQTAAQAAVRPLEPSLAYTVKASDKLIRLSRDMLVSGASWNDVAKYNQLKDPNAIFPGQKIDIPLRLLKSQPATGKVISAEGDVRLGDAPMQPGAAVTDGSQLKTGPNSSAVIELGDGSRIKILPNSLAQVVTNRDYAMRDASSSGSTNWFSGLMRLSEGALEALASKTSKRATPLQIETPTSVVGVRGTEFRVAYDDPANKSARTEVLEGKVRADNPAQASGADLFVGTGAIIKPLEKDIKVVALLPAPDLSGVPAEVLKPQGSWPMPALVGASSYRVQVASDAQFDKIVRDLKVASSSADLSTLPNGNWFARVRGIDGQGLEGLNTSKLIAVKDGQWRVTSSSMAVVQGKTVLSWLGAPSGGGPYAAVLGRDMALSQAAVTLQGSNDKDASPSIVLGTLTPGVYYIALQTSAGLRSETYRFELSGNWGQTVFDQTSVLQAVK